MKKVNFFSGLFLSSSQKNLYKLEILEAEIRKIEKMENKVESIVRLFQIISPYQDAGGFIQDIINLKKQNQGGKFSSQIRALQILQMHIENAGRDKNGYNRTVKGERVTEEKVFLGDVRRGLSINAAAYWLREKSNLEKNFRSFISEDAKKPVSDWYLINDYLCGSFVKSHCDGILEQIRIFKSVK